MPKFVQSSPVVVVLVGLFAPADRDLVLGYFGLQGAVAWVSMLDPSDPTIDEWIASQNAGLGYRSRELRPGYYLFLAGTARAYQSGLIDFKRDQVVLGLGALAALIGIAWESVGWVKTATVIVGVPAAMRVIDAFSRVIDSLGLGAGAPPSPATPPPPSSTTSRPPPNSTRSAPPPRPRPSRPPAPPPINEVAVAFETLDLAQNATHAEVKARYRSLAKQWHPDRHAGAGAKANEVGMRMTQINLAYSVICTARCW